MRPASLAIIVALTVCFPFCGGCAEFNYKNTATTFDRPFKGSDDTLSRIWLKTSYLYPVRDILTFTWLGRALTGDRAWNVTPDGGVADGPFFVNRDIRAVTPEEARRGPATAPSPIGPWRIKKAKETGLTPGFIGQDSTGRTFLVKLDHSDYPEMGTAAEIIGSRLMWLIGYHVPAFYVITIEGTGDPRYDGRRATASLFVEGDVVGGFKFDHYRMRREVRALRLVAVWLNDTDRVDNNTLVSVQDGQAVCYQVDFNSCLGSWNGRPKDAWRGCRHAWDVEYQLLGLVTLGCLPRLPDGPEMTSPAVGAVEGAPAMSAGRWKSQNANTAFDRMTPEDALWMARRMASVSREQLEAIVSAARLSRPEDADRLVRILLERRAWVLSEKACLDPAINRP